MKITNKRVVAIGDIHGLDTWKKIIGIELEKDANTFFVFLGDYLDSFEIKREPQLANFLDILHFKASNPSTVTLLTGNHDLHYLPFIESVCSGFDYIFKLTVKHILKDAYFGKQIRMCVEIDNRGKKYLLTHAGVSSVWLNNNNISTSHVMEGINKLFDTRPQLFNFTNGSDTPGDGYGYSEHQTPVWIRPKTINKICVEGFKHVVGHTWNKKVVDKHYKNLILCDALPNEYLIIEKSGEAIRASLKR